MTWSCHLIRGEPKNTQVVLNLPRSGKSVNSSQGLLSSGINDNVEKNLVKPSDRRSLWHRKKGTQDQAFRILIMPAKTRGFAVCLRNGGFGASLEVRKLYPFIKDPDVEANNLIRVVDESGEDYLYPARLFRKLALPSDVQRALRMAS
jgi:hypothetical protein